MSEVSVAVLGAGRWARALSMVMARNQQDAGNRSGRVMLYRPPEPGQKGSRAGVEKVAPSPGKQPAVVKPATEDATVQMSADALLNIAGEVYAEPIELPEIAEAQLLVLAVQARAVRPLLRSARRFLRPDQIMVHAVGSFAPGESARESHGSLISEVIRQETPIQRLGALAGPALAEDLEEGNHAALVCGSGTNQVGAAVRRMMAGPNLRVHLSPDMIGVEVARATSSVVSLACGVADTLKFGAAARATLVARGAAEMSQLALVLGGNDLTFLGLAGSGEMIAATERRGIADYQLGQMLGRGVVLAEAERQIGRVCDGIGMVHEGYLIAQRFSLRAPMLTTLQQWLTGQLDVKVGLSELLDDEIYLD